MTAAYRPVLRSNSSGYLAHLLSVGTKFEPEFGGYHHLSTKGSKRFAHEFFVGERAIRFCICLVSCL